MPVITLPNLVAMALCSRLERIAALRHEARLKQEEFCLVA
jgi:hypothetical protein